MQTVLIDSCRYDLSKFMKKHIRKLLGTGCIMAVVATVCTQSLVVSSSRFETEANGKSLRQGAARVLVSQLW